MLCSGHTWARLAHLGAPGHAWPRGAADTMVLPGILGRLPGLSFLICRTEGPKDRKDPPNRALDCTKEICMLNISRWPEWRGAACTSGVNPQVRPAGFTSCGDGGRPRVQVWGSQLQRVVECGIVGPSGDRNPGGAGVEILGPGCWRALMVVVGEEVSAGVCMRGAVQ